MARSLVTSSLEQTGSGLGARLIEQPVVGRRLRPPRFVAVRSVAHPMLSDRL
jgi:hypothetical protein